MKTSIVYVSASGNTKLLAEAIARTLGEDGYVGTPDDAALAADVIYVGFWTMAFAACPPIQNFLKTLKGKKVFLFGTAGYDDTPEYFERMLDTAKACLDDSNTVIGSYMCLGKVSAAKQEAIKKMDEAKYETMKPALEASQGHPSDADVEALVAMVSALK